MVKYFVINETEGIFSFAKIPILLFNAFFVFSTLQIGIKGHSILFFEHSLAGKL